MIRNYLDCVFPHAISWNMSVNVFVWIFLLICNYKTVSVIAINEITDIYFLYMNIQIDHTFFYYYAYKNSFCLTVTTITVYSTI